MIIDLQIHSTYSDGYFTPAETAKFIAAQGVKIASLTDHNTVGGQDEFKKACRHYGIKTITGLETYTKLNHKKFNLLWFNFDDKSPDLHILLRESQIRRRAMVRTALRKISEFGYKIKIDKIVDKYTHYIPINRVAENIYSLAFNKKRVNKYLENKKPRIEEIIKELFYNKEIGILHESYIDIERIIKLRKIIGGQLILNHPAKFGFVNKNFVIKLKKLGIDGIEVLSPHHSIGAIMYLQYLACELNLIETGSSDFHLNEGGNYLIQNSSNYFKIDSKYLRGVEKIIG